MNINHAREILKNKISDELFIHSLGVEEMALRLAVAYGIDVEKAALAAILHDYGKIRSEDDLFKIAEKHSIVDPLTLQEPALLHAPVGAWLLEQELGIRDREIIDAVKNHTTGIPGMSLLAKIVYLADYIEPSRSCPGVQVLREIALYDLQRALLFAVDMTLKYVIESERLVHPHSIAFRNSLILSIRNNNQELQNYEAY
jgi:predicted HD superfamily hydrolase involved in NAD metabolism